MLNIRWDGDSDLGPTTPSFVASPPRFAKLPHRPLKNTASRRAPGTRGFLESDHYGKWASVIYHPATGLRHLAITKHDSSARMPSDDFGTLLFLFCPCPFPLSFTGARTDGTEGRRNGSRSVVAPSPSTERGTSEAGCCC